jgi:hypothetical protein
MFGDVQEAPAARAHESLLPSLPATTKEIPYDHVAVFSLLGKPGNRIPDVITISIEAAFVAVAMGYSFIPAPLLLPVPPPPTVASVTPQSEALANWLLTVMQNQPALSTMLVSSLLTRVCGIEFKYSFLDAGTGRELQSRPIHNIAGLGESTGQRPFRPFAKPMLFMPRSNIRIEVEEISAGPIYEGAQLYIVLHGYKVLGYGTRP